MNERIRLLAEQAFTAVGTTHDSITHRDQSVLDKNNSITSYTFTQNTMEKFAELLLKKTFTIIAESMIDTEADLKIDEIIADRLDEAAVDVCDELDIMNGIYRV